MERAIIMTKEGMEPSTTSRRGFPFRIHWYGERRQPIDIDGDGG